MTMLYMNGFDQYDALVDLKTDEDVIEISEDVNGVSGYNVAGTVPIPWNPTACGTDPDIGAYVPATNNGPYGERTLVFGNGAHNPYWMTFGFGNGSKEVNIGLQVYCADMSKPLMFRLKDNAGNVLFEIQNGLNTADYNVVNGDGELLEIIEGFSGGTWFNFQMKVYIDGTFGFYRIFRNSTLVGSGTNVNTSNTVSFTDRVEQLQIHHIGFILDEAYCDDLWITNDQGAAPNNDLMGALAMTRMIPNSDNSVQWTPSHGGSNHGSVSQRTGVESTTFVRGTYTGQKDLYGTSLAPTHDGGTKDGCIGPLPILDQVAVQVQARVSDISGEPGRYKLLLDGQASAPIQTKTGSESFATHMQIIENPSNVGSIEIGIEAAD